MTPEDFEQIRQIVQASHNRAMTAIAAMERRLAAIEAAIEARRDNTASAATQAAQRAIDQLATRANEQRFSRIIQDFEIVLDSIKRLERIAGAKNRRK